MYVVCLQDVVFKTMIDILAVYSSITSVVFLSSKIKLYPYHAFEDFFGSTSSLPHFGQPVAILLFKLNIRDGWFNSKVLNTSILILVAILI